jgi:putative ABC transport system permease protein
MRFIDYFAMAFHNLWRQKLRSILTIFAVVIGATSITIMLALVFGAKNFFSQQLNANGTIQQIEVTSQPSLSNFNQQGGGSDCSSVSQNAGACVTLTDALAAKIAAIPHIIGVARRAQVYNIQTLVYGDKKLPVNNLNAYDANGVITNTMVAGRDINARDTTGVITLSSDYADALGFKGNYQALIGKQVQLITGEWYTGVGANLETPAQMQTSNDAQPTSPPPATLTATVVGITSATQGQETLRIPLPWARQILEQQQYVANNAPTNCATLHTSCQPTYTLHITDQLAEQGYSALMAKVDNVNNAAAATTTIKKLGVGAADAQSFINSQLTIFNVVGLVLGSIGGIALAVSAIGIVNTMVMAILERTREIGVMRAVGARRSTVRRLFTFEASLLGFWGGVFGLCLGYALTRIANILINNQLSKNSLQVRNIIQLPLWLILTVIGITTVIGFLAGLYPARRAAKLDPVEALRHE